MGGSVSLTGNDVLTLNGRVFTDFANNAIATLTFDADLVTVQTSKDGNIVYALNEAGKSASLTLRLILGSSDDRYMNSLLASLRRDMSSFVLILGSFVKRVGDGKGNVKNVIYNVTGGIITKIPGASMNTTGDVEQSIAEWELRFGDASARAIM